MEITHDAQVLAYVMQIAEKDGLSETKQVIQRAMICVERDIYKAQLEQSKIHAVEEEDASANG